MADNFDEWRYLASNPDLIGIFGTNTNLATQHYVKYGYNEGRQTQNFNSAQYLNNYPNLLSLYGNNLNAAVIRTSAVDMQKAEQILFPFYRIRFWFWYIPTVLQI